MKTKQSNNSVTTTDAVKIASQRALFNLEWENDTVFKKRELNYKTKAAFQKDLEAGKISKYTTVFIKDSKEIYKNGQYYGSSEGGGVSGNFAEYMSVNSELSLEILSNLKPPFGKQTTFTPSEGLKNLLINNVSKNIALVIFNYENTNVAFNANIAGDSETEVTLIINMYTFPALLGFGASLSLIAIDLHIKLNSATIAASPLPFLSSESTGNSFFCDDGTFKKESYILNLPKEVLIGTETYRGNLSKDEYDGLVDSYKNNIPITVRLTGLYDVRNCIVSDNSDRYELEIPVTIQYGGVLTIVATIIINKSDYSYYSIISQSGMTSPSEAGEIQLYASSTQTSKTNISLRTNGAGTKFLSDDGQYKTIETISSAVSKIDSNSDGTGEIFNNYEGEDLNISKGNSSHAEGKKTQANSNGSHAEGIETIAGDLSDPKNGKGAHAEGQATTALGNGSHAEGYNTKALKDQSHAEGYQTLAIGNYAHAEGGGAVKVDEAFYTKTDSEIIAEWERLFQTPTEYEKGDGFSMAKGKGSHSEGKNTLALGDYSHTSGEATVAKSYCQTAIGRFNEPTTSGYNEFSISNEAFVIGNGTDISSKGNAFKVLFNGQTYADGAYSGSGADYAEFFEWKDENESNEDRVGLFVSIENDKIVKATKDSKYILGIVSGNPSVIGDNPMRWKNKYLTDKFGRPIYEEVEVKKYEKKINDNGEEEIVEIIEKQKIFKINPEWDSSKEYISRESRKEWSAIGLMGKLIVRHDGTLKQGGFCYPSENGIATNSETGYYVMKVYEDTALIMFK